MVLLCVQGYFRAGGYFKNHQQGQLISTAADGLRGGELGSWNSCVWAVSQQRAVEESWHFFFFFFFATASLNALHGDVFISYYLIQQQMGLWGEVLCLGWQVKTVFLNNNNKVPDMIPRQSSNPTND